MSAIMGSWSQGPSSLVSWPSKVASERSDIGRILPMFPVIAAVAPRHRGHGARASRRQDCFRARA